MGVMATDVMVDAERVEGGVLPRVLNEMADVVDKISNAEAPLTHVGVWLLGAAALTGLAIEERFAGMPKVSNDVREYFGKWAYSSPDIVESIATYSKDPVTKVFIEGQIDLFREMVREKDFGMALTTIASMSMVIFGGMISEKAGQPVKISERVGKLPGVGETISKNLRNLSGAIQKGK